MGRYSSSINLGAGARQAEEDAKQAWECALVILQAAASRMHDQSNRLKNQKVCINL